MQLPAAVIFDFDGVVADTEGLHYRAFQQVLTPEGLGYDWETYVADYIGFDDRDAFRHRLAAAGMPCPPARLEALIERKAEAFLALVAAGDLRPYPGVAALMDACASAGVPVGLCSGATRADIDAILSGMSLPGRFAARITADDVEVSKPDPESYRRIVAALARAVPGLAADPARMAAIEDTPAGIAAARGAGVRVVGVATTHPPEALNAADRVYAGLAECGLADLGALTAAAADANGLH